MPPAELAEVLMKDCDGKDVGAPRNSDFWLVADMPLISFEDLRRVLWLASLA